MLPFCLDFAMRAPSPAFVLRAYFDERLTAQIDERVGLAGRTVLELDEGPVLRRVSSVVMRRALPGWLRQLVPEGVTCREEARWDRGLDRMSLAIQPIGRARRARIDSLIEVRSAAGTLHWRQTGEVRVDVRLLGRRVERFLVDEFTASVGGVVAATQAWLDEGIVHARPQPRVATLP